MILTILLVLNQLMILSVLFLFQTVYPFSDIQISELMVLSQVIITILEHVISAF